jgi:predicted RNA-binding Zn-ribbon protein involved in translation (DUF1610 family)
MAMTKRATVESIRESFPVEDRGRIFEYFSEGSRQSLRFICKSCGRTVTEEWRARSLKNLNCKNCNQSIAARERIATGVSKTFGENCRKFDTDAVRAIFTERGATPTFDHYQNASQALTFLCACGQPGSITFRNLYYVDPRCGAITIPRCKACAAEFKIQYATEKCASSLPHMTGEDHWNWNPELTDEERLANESRGPEFVKWAWAVKERDNFTCRISGKKGIYLVSHHLNNWADFPELRFDLSNGVTISAELHTEFHSLYGRSNNTIEQFNTFRARFGS